MGRCLARIDAQSVALAGDGTLNIFATGAIHAPVKCSAQVSLNVRPRVGVTFSKAYLHSCAVAPDHGFPR
jgi:hypothetical protein